jgi:hypothetical protein
MPAVRRHRPLRAVAVHQRQLAGRKPAPSAPGRAYPGSWTLGVASSAGANAGVAGSDAPDTAVCDGRAMLASPPRQAANGWQFGHGRGASPSNPSSRVTSSQAPPHAGFALAPPGGTGSSPGDNLAARTAYGLCESARFGFEGRSRPYFPEPDIMRFHAAPSRTLSRRRQRRRWPGVRTWFCRSPC